MLKKLDRWFTYSNLFNIITKTWFGTLIFACFLFLWYLTGIKPCRLVIDIFICFLIFTILSIPIAGGLYFIQTNINDSNILKDKIDIARLSIFPIVAGVIGFFITERFIGTRTPIIGAISDHAITSPSSDIIKYHKNTLIDPANKMLGGYGSFLEFDLKVISRPYGSIFDALDNGIAHFGFVNPYTYIYRYQDAQKNGFRLLGLKYTNQGKQYSTGFIYERGSRAGNFLEKYGEDLKNEKIGGASNYQKEPNREIDCVYFWDEYLSTSGHVVPERWLLEQGGNWAKLAATARSVPPHELIMNTKGRNIAAISKDLWMRIIYSDSALNEKYGYFEIPDFPIPFDAVVVKDSMWNEICKNDWHRLIDFLSLRELRFWKYREDFIMDALRPMIKRVEENSTPTDEWIDLNKSFIVRLNSIILYLEEGIAYLPKNPDKINFPEKEVAGDRSCFEIMGTIKWERRKNDSAKPFQYDFDAKIEKVYPVCNINKELYVTYQSIFDYYLFVNPSSCNVKLNSQQIDKTFLCHNFYKIYFSNDTTHLGPKPVRAVLTMSSDTSLYFKKIE